MWAVLAAARPRRGLAGLVDRTWPLARRFASGLSAGGLEVLNDVVLNQVPWLRRWPDATDAVVPRVQREGTCWCGPTTWRGRRGHADQRQQLGTTEADIDRSVAAVLAAAQQASAHH